MVESAKEVCGSVGVVGKNPKSVWQNDKVKTAVRRKEVKRCIYQSQKK